jgi:hypothetical protein
VHNVWKYYNAMGVVREHYPRLKQYVSTLEAQYHKTGLKTYFCTYGDWNPVVKTSCHVTAAGSFLHDVLRMSELAAAVGEVADAARYSALLDTLRHDYHRAFWNNNTQQYDAGTQMAQAFPLWLNATPASLRKGVAAKLALEVSTKGLTVGMIGVRYMFEALAVAGHIEEVS